MRNLRSVRYEGFGLAGLNSGTVLDELAVLALMGNAGGGAPQRVGTGDPGQVLPRRRQRAGRRVDPGPVAAGQVVEEVEATGVDVHPGRPQAAGAVRRDRID